MGDERERVYFYEVDLQGRLLHDGTELTDARFLDFFFRRLVVNDTGRHADWPFVSPCGRELNFVRPRDRVIVFRKLTAAGDLVYAADLRVRFDAGALRFSPAGRLYHLAPVGEYGLLRSALVLQLGERIVERDGVYLLVERGESRPIRALES